MEFLVLLIIVLLFCGIGYWIGNTVGKPILGLFMGLFLGPIGWIVVLLLPTKPLTSAIEAPTTTSRGAKNAPVRDLNSDAYKLYLAERFKIERNEVFEKFVCDEKMFDSLSDALTYADELASKETKVPLGGVVLELESALELLQARGYFVSDSPTATNRKYRIVNPDHVGRWMSPDEVVILASQVRNN